MDTPSVSLEITIIAILIIINGLLVMTEMSVIESRKNKLEKLADTGNTGAKFALNIIEEPTRVLSSTQIGITLIGILIGTLAGEKLAPALGSYFEKIPYAAPYADITALLLIVAVITYITLVIGELIPKKIATYNPEPILSKLAKPLRYLEKITQPLVSFLSFSTNFTLSLIGINSKKETTITEDEIRTLIEQGTEEGTFEKTEQDMVDKIFRLSDQKASALMTPRTQMIWLDLEESLEQNLTIINENPDTTFPVAKDSLDEFVGILHTKDLLKRSLAGESINLEKCIHTPMFIPKSMPSFKVLENFQETGTHEAIVLDEFGGVVGFITMKDIVSEVLGDISANQDPEPIQIIKRDETSWLIDGLLPIDEFKDHFDLDELPDEDRDQYQTMGGFITSYLDYIPVASEHFIWNGFKFEVVDMDRVRVDKILVTKLPSEENIAS
ncbi:hemolysin family protein [Anaerosinus massiliensis]|uniref:hemolysin family protein n=1 Tax=Massilibacillus massiliensis TaxID=1806837 RepID=UPI000A74349C|nr:hemolysin family protein [Massilibacillus massiliensis]